MKPSYYMYAAIAVLLIAGAVVLFRVHPDTERTAIVACVESGGTYDVVNKVCNPPAKATAASPSSGASTAVAKPAAAVADPRDPVKKPGAVNTKVPELPTYYAQQLASTTLQVHLLHPASNALVASPMVVDGEARGTWYFEGSFPVILTNWDGLIIAQGHAKAQNSWMTPDFVPFTTTLTFPRQKSGSKGYLILKKDNPSGLPQNDAAVEITVTF